MPAWCITTRSLHCTEDVQVEKSVELPHGQHFIMVTFFRLLDVMYVLMEELLSSEII